MGTFLAEVLCCPIDQSSVSIAEESVVCERGHRFPCANGIPIMLDPSMPPTHYRIFETTQECSENTHLRGMSLEEAEHYARDNVGGTCGLFYLGKGGSLDRLPIPQLLVPRGHGRLLDIGCGWGRWCIAAAQQGYTVIGIDPFLDSVRSAQALTRHLGLSAEFVVGDARCLPFRQASFDVVHSYAVFLHFAKEDTTTAVQQIGRVLRKGGRSFVQLPNARGLRNLSVQVSRGFRESRDSGDFSTRYWKRRDMRELFETYVGTSTLNAEGFGYTSAGGIPQGGVAGLPWKARVTLTISETLRRLALRVPVLGSFADSVYVQSIRDAT